MNSQPPEERWKLSFAEKAFLSVLSVGLSPVWIPMALIENIRFRFKVRPLIRGRIEDAWERCSKVWQEAGCVAQKSSHTGAAFGHWLAVALARRHRKQKRFFLNKLADPIPINAAYAFKCLVCISQLRSGSELQRCDIPDPILDRQEMICFHWADLLDSQSLADFFEMWFFYEDRDRELSANIQRSETHG